MDVHNDFGFDKILESVEGNGRYQQALLWVFLAPLNFMIPWMIFVPIFQSSVPEHWCHVPGRPEDVPVDQWKNRTIPWIEKEGKLELSKCLQYIRSDGEFEANFSSSDVEACSSGWDYDHKWYDRTLPTDKDWVCDKDSYRTRWLSVGVAGNFVGILIFCYLSDLFGRKPVLLALTQMYVIFALVRIYVTSEWAAMTTIFLSTMPFPAAISVSFILVVEQVPSAMRTRINSVSCILWTVGMSVLPVVVWLTRNWITLGIVTSIPFVVFVLIWWLLPESPRWLILQKRLAETLTILERISKINGTPSSPNLKISLEEYAKLEKVIESNSYLGVLQLFKYPTLRKRTIILTVCYVCNNFMYYGLIYNISNMSGNEFLNFFLMAITEFPANFIGWISAQYLGRRWTQTAFLTLAALSVMAATFTPPSIIWVQTALLITGKTLISVSFLVIYLQFAEIYPTSYRASGLGFSSVIGQASGMAAPYVAYSSTYWSKLPTLILTIVGAIGGIVSTLIPETLGYDLPQTAVEADGFLRDQPFWSYRGKRFWKKSALENMPKVLPKVANTQSAFT